MVSLKQNQNVQASKRDLVITQKPTQDLPIFATLRKTMTVNLTQARKIFFFSNPEQDQHNYLPQTGFTNLLIPKV